LRVNRKVIGLFGARRWLALSNPFVLIAISAALLLISNGAHDVPLAAWLSPVFVLRFVRTQRLRLGLPVAYVLLATAFAFQFRDMIPMPGVVYVLLAALVGFVVLALYLIDRLLAPRLTGVAQTLVFPTACAAAEWLLSRAGVGTWGSVAYSQYGDLPLLQLLSVTGLWGVTFVVSWPAAVCNLFWEDGFGSAKARTAAWLCAGAIAGVFLVGGLSLALSQPSSKTVRVAALTKRPIGPPLAAALVSRQQRGKASGVDLETIRRSDAVVNDDLLSRAEREMQAGAKIVLWGEGNARMMPADEPAFIARGQALAAKYNAYLGMAVLVWRPSPVTFENKLVLAQPDGTIAWSSAKARPVPGAEAAMQVRGSGVLPILASPYGRLSSVICYDADFPDLLAQAGAKRTDILLVPSNDWRAIDPWHTQMASFRAIEQGLNLIRPTSEGLSAAFDDQGRRLATTDYFDTSDFAMVSNIPTQGRRTVYTVLGDWFAYLCMAGLAGLGAFALMRGHRVTGAFAGQGDAYPSCRT
jgi:apolipoprotein N-acyltransferase